jgi:hypothetical protein
VGNAVIITNKGVICVVEKVLRRPLAATPKLVAVMLKLWYIAPARCGGCYPQLYCSLSFLPWVTICLLYTPMYADTYLATFKMSMTACCLQAAETAKEAERSELAYGLEQAKHKVSRHAMVIMALTVQCTW